MWGRSVPRKARTIARWFGERRRGGILENAEIRPVALVGRIPSRAAYWPPFAHTWPTRRPGVAARPVLPVPFPARRAATPARSPRLRLRLSRSKIAQQPLQRLLVAVVVLPSLKCAGYAVCPPPKAAARSLPPHRCGIGPGHAIEDADVAVILSHPSASRRTSTAASNSNPGGSVGISAPIHLLVNWCTFE